MSSTLLIGSIWLLVMSLFTAAWNRFDNRPDYAVRVENLATDGVMIPDTPTPTPAPTAPAVTFRPVIEQWRPLVSQYEWDADQALECIDQESDGDAAARNPESGACGLFQYHPAFPGCEVPEVNVEAAYLKWLDGGRDWWKHWGRHGGCQP